MRIIGLDLGTKTLGVAISDKTLSIATPKDTFRFKSEDYDDAVKYVIDLANKYDTSKIVLGLPKNMDGTEGFAAKRSYEFGEKLLLAGLDVDYTDERLTTKSALDLMHMQNKTEKDSKHKIDSVSAAIILESYLKKYENSIK